MPNLRSMIDGMGALEINVPSITRDHTFNPQDDVIIRRKTNRSGPSTSEVIAGRILAVGDSTADISINNPYGGVKRITVNLNDLTPVSESFRRQSIQFNSSYRRRA